MSARALNLNYRGLTNPPIPTRIIFLQRAFPIGGIETLVLRLANRMVELGHAVTVTGRRSEMSARLDPRIEFLEVTGHAHIVKQVTGRLVGGGGDAILVSLHPWELADAGVITARLAPTGMAVRSVHVVTHSRAFFFGGRFPGKNWMYRRFFESAPRESTFFMNEAARQSHATFWGRDLADYPVLRLALDLGERKWDRAASASCDIVSIGRLVPFKGYNLEAPTIVRQLRSKGIDLRWTIWGFGESEDEIHRRIANEGVTDCVTVAGPLPYARLADEVMKHDLFVGMGTALLEAAATGIPAICAVENHSAKSYGFLDETPTDSVGDVVTGVSMNELADDILRYARMSATEREAVSKAGARSAEERSTTLDETIDTILAAPPWRIAPRDAWFARAAILVGALKEKTIDRVR